LSWQRICLQCRRPGFDPWATHSSILAWRIPWTTAHGVAKKIPPSSPETPHYKAPCLSPELKFISETSVNLSLITLINGVSFPLKCVVTLPLDVKVLKGVQKSLKAVIQTGWVSSLTANKLLVNKIGYLHVRFKEKCVMNNYFGIGLDAKISLEFNTRRDEHPGQYNSRFKNKMWYGLLGSKELFQRSYRKLEERVHLECDGEAISLPNLQGIVVLNITSYAGGVNFWGSSTATTEYEAPAIDDGKLEVVAIFGSVQMAMSRIINLHHHRIAQCREVMITINGEEGIPVQVDGEAWVQRPGLIKIRYKNTAQMLTRDRDFENSMKMWECKHSEIQAASQPQLDTQESQDSLSDEEYAQMQHLTRLAENLISRLTDLSKVHQHVSVLMDSVNASAKTLNDVFYKQESNNETAAASCIPIETLTRNDAVDVTFSLKGLYDDTKAFLDENLLRNAEYEATLKISLDAMNKEFEKLSKIDWMNSILFPEEKSSDTDSKSFRLKVKFPKLGKKKSEEECKPKSGQGIQGFIGKRHRRHGFDPWVGKNPWRRSWQPTPVFLPGK
ncbi:hypothetical protein FD755_023887, partial [Muntiacus reevesi]